MSQLQGVAAPIGLVVEPDVGLLQQVRDLAAMTELDGVAMFEFRRNRKSGGSTLLEVNPRFWGSLPLAVATGVDFPWLWYRQLIHGEDAPRMNYKSYYFARALTADLEHINSLLSVLYGRNMKAFVATAVRYAVGSLRLIILKEKHDTFSWSDPLPAIIEYKRVLIRIFHRLWPEGNATRIRSARQRRLRAERRLAERKIADFPSIAFICYGNICRSPFAEARLRAKLDFGVGEQLVSTGMVPTSNRCAPPTAVQAAANWGVDLTGHRSRYLMAQELEAYDLIIGFDKRTVAGLREIGVNRKFPVLSLGDFLPEAAICPEIADPYGKGDHVFETTYELIDRALDGLVKFVAVQTRGVAAEFSDGPPTTGTS